MIRQVHLGILGSGAVSPRGAGVAALLEPGEWPRQTVPTLTAKSGSEPAFRVELKQPALEKWQQHPRLRRVSPITLFMMEAAQQALDEARAVRPERLGIIAALSSGCIVYTRKFLQDSIQEGRRFASPLLFPETVFNAPASHLASVLGVPGPCYSLVGDDSCWVTALRAAACWIEGGTADHVLVVSGEELDAISMEAFRCGGWLRRNSRFIPAEGAAAVVVGRAEDGGRVRITAMADGWKYRDRKGAILAARQCKAALGNGKDIYLSAGRTWLGEAERQVFGGSEPQFPYLGQAFPVSAGWHMLRAAALLDKARPGLWLPIWGLNEQVSALQLSLA